MKNLLVDTEILKSDPKDQIVVELGDHKDPLTRPQFKVTRWTNDANLSVRAIELPDGRFLEEDGKLKYITSKYEVHMYSKPEAGEDGGYEFEWILSSKPESNLLTATLEMKNVAFYKQEELTDEEKAFGAVRADNVIGSYAVYYDHVRRNPNDREYRTGKFCHIYRPKAIDSVGNEVWCDIFIDSILKILTVTVPQEFLNNAIYPVVVDPTFGYTSIGGSSFSGSEDIAVALRATAPDNGTIDSISCYFDQANAGENLKGIVYSDAVSPVKITNGIGDTIGGSLGWITSAMSTPPTIVDGTVYYIGIVQESPFNGFRYDTGGVSNQMKYGALTYSSPENTWSSPSNFDWFLSVYATYTAAITGDTKWFI